MAEEIISLRIGKELRNKMKLHDEMNWSAVLRKAIESKLDELVEIEKLKKRLESKDEQEFTKWSIQLGKKTKKERFKKFLDSLSEEERKELLKK